MTKFVESPLRPLPSKLGVSGIPEGKLRKFDIAWHSVALERFSGSVAAVHSCAFKLPHRGMIFCRGLMPECAPGKIKRDEERYVDAR